MGGGTYSFTVHNAWAHGEETNIGAVHGVDSGIAWVGQLQGYYPIWEYNGTGIPEADAAPIVIGHNINNPGILSTLIHPDTSDWLDILSAPLTTTLYAPPGQFQAEWGEGGTTGGQPNSASDHVGASFGETAAAGSVATGSSTGVPYGTFTNGSSGVDTIVWCQVDSQVACFAVGIKPGTANLINSAYATLYYDEDITVYNWFGHDPSDYFDVTNWSAGTVPNGVDAVAMLGYQDAARTTPQPATTVTLSQNLTLGTLLFDNPNSYTVNGPGTLTLQASNGNDAEIIVSQGSHVVNAATTLASNTDFYIAPGAQLSMAALSMIAMPVSVSGGGTLSMPGTQIETGSSLSVSAGTVNIGGVLDADAGSSVSLVGNPDGTGATLHCSAVETIGASYGTPVIFNQSGGTNNAGFGLQIGQNGPANYNLSAGIVSSYESIVIGWNIGCDSTFSQTGGSVTAAIVDVGTHAPVTASYMFSGGSIAAGAENVGGSAGTASFSQSGGTNTVSGNLTITSAGSGSGIYTLTGGTLNVSGMLNVGNGTFEFDGGSLTANVDNHGTFNVRGGGTQTLNGNFTNEAGAMLKTYGTTFSVTGTFTNNGTYSSDPADNHFGTLNTGPNGKVLGGVGDHFFVSGDFLSSSTNAAGWNTSLAALIFPNGKSGQHTLDVNGADFGPMWGGFSNNFAWGVLILGDGQSLELVDANDAANAALYIGSFQLAGGLAQLADISANDVNVYYDAQLNPWFGDQIYSLAGGGELIPLLGTDTLLEGRLTAAVAAVPEPASFGLIAIGGLVILRRRRRQ